MQVLKQLIYLPCEALHRPAHAYLEPLVVAHASATRV